MLLKSISAILLISSSCWAGTTEKKPRDKIYDHMDGGVMDMDDANEFEGMTTKEKKHHLIEICKKIDVDGSSTLDENELERWMEITSEKYMEQDIDNQWPTHDLNSDGKITWEEYQSSVFDMMGEDDFVDEKLSIDQMKKRDQRRFNRADVNNNGFLTKDEFSGFLHPEDHTHMKDIVVQETLEDLDLDNDGVISMEEYIADLYHPDDDQIANAEEPEWLVVEKTHFKNIRDTNKDGSLDLAEVKNWLMPTEYNHIKAEASHLMLECDDDKDGHLTFDEVLDKYDVFLTSQVTNWGEALSYHSEL